MTDIQNEAEVIPKKLSFIFLTSENRPRTSSIADNLAVDYYTAITSVAPTIIEDTDDNDDDDVPLFSIRQIYKNLIILSLTFVLIFTSFSGILALQSSVNVKGNVGVNSLIIYYAFTLFSSIFFTGISIDIFGLKWTIIIGNIAYVLYTCANIRPIPLLMYTTATFTGLGAAPLWVSQATYISRLARYYVHHKQTNVDIIVSLFFGIFFAILGTCTIWGNLISYFVLNQSNNPQKMNCGIYFDPLLKTDTKEPDVVSESTRYVLFGIFAGTGIVSAILIFLLLDQVRLAKSQPVAQSLKKSVEVLQSLFRWKHIDQLFLVPLTMWTMIESAFLTAQFTRAFIACLVGIRFIGLVMISNGVCNTMGSYIFGRLVKYIGRLGCFIIAALLNYSMIILMYFWEPVEDQMFVLYIISGLWGVASAVWQSQVIATYTVLYAENDPSAIAKYRVWKSLGSVVTYSYASYLTIQVTLIMLFVFLTVSMIFYGVVEIHVRRKNYAKKSGTVYDHC